MDRRQTFGVMIRSALGTWTNATVGQDQRSVRVVVPHVPSGRTESMVRFVEDSIQKGLGWTATVDSRPGGTGLIATRYLQAAAPDGTHCYSINPASHRCDAGRP